MSVLTGLGTLVEISHRGDDGGGMVVAKEG
jgi:hypothetical protein